MKIKTLFLVFLLIGANTIAQNVNNIQMPEIMQQSGRKTINVPDLLGYQTLKCDFHMHTVFSDGSVWPTVRVDEIWEDGLDCFQ